MNRHKWVKSREQQRILDFKDGKERGGEERTWGFVERSRREELKRGKENSSKPEAISH